MCHWTCTEIPEFSGSPDPGPDDGFGREVHKILAGFARDLRSGHRLLQPQFGIAHYDGGRLQNRPCLLRLWTPLQGKRYLLPWRHRPE